MYTFCWIGFWKVGPPLLVINGLINMDFTGFFFTLLIGALCHCPPRRCKGHTWILTFLGCPGKEVDGSMVMGSMGLIHLFENGLYIGVKKNPLIRSPLILTSNRWSFRRNHDFMAYLYNWLVLSSSQKAQINPFEKYEWSISPGKRVITPITFDPNQP